MQVTLNGGQSDAIVVAPLLSSGTGAIDSTNSTANGTNASSAFVEFAPIGLTRYINGGGAILSASMQSGTAAASALSAPSPQGSSIVACDHAVVGDGGAAARLHAHACADERAVTCTVSVRGCGELLMYCSQEPSQVRVRCCKPARS